MPEDSNGLKTVIEMLREIASEGSRSSDRLDKLEARFDRLEATVQTLAQIMMNGFERVDRRFEQLEAKLDKRIDELTQTVRVSLGTVRGALEHDDARIARLESELLATQRRVEALEKKSA
ncbi:MAG: hypothetical protein HYV07_07045 [Deltaproteobacteria bacterium]|nr:hypothetical protein [Deltaproteobacteria bacterium]